MGSFKRYAFFGLVLFLNLAPAHAQYFLAGDHILISRGQFWTWALDTTDLLDEIAGPRLARIEQDIAHFPDSLDRLMANGPRRLSPQLIGANGAADGNTIVYRTATGVGWEAVPAGGADSTKSVSKNRDDADIQGEKDFLGEVAVTQRILHIGTSTAGTPASMAATRGGLFLQTDTASLRATLYAFLIQQTGSLNSMGVRESGIVDFQRQSAFRGYRSSNQSITSAASQLSCNAETWDQQNEHRQSGSGAYRFTALEAGKYHVYSRATVITPTAHTVFLMIYRNGTQNTLGATYSSSPVPYAGNASYPVVQNEIQLSAGDYLEIYVQSSVSGYMYGASDETYFIVRKVL